MSDSFQHTSCVCDAAIAIAVLSVRPTVTLVTPAPRQNRSRIKIERTVFTVQYTVIIHMRFFLWQKSVIEGSLRTKASKWSTPAGAREHRGQGGQPPTQLCHWVGTQCILLTQYFRIYMYINVYSFSLYMCFPCTHKS